jgi:hypothetical protein
MKMPTNLLQNLREKLKNEVAELKRDGDLLPLLTTIVFFAIGSCIALFWMPAKLSYTGEKASDIARSIRLPDLRNAHQALFFAITFAIAQIPLEFISAKNQRFKRRFKTWLVIAASISAYIAFYFSF